MRKFALLALVALAAWPLTATPAQNAPGGDGSVVENPFRGVMQDRSARTPDEALFVEKCGMCHRQMGMGTVILARRMDPKLAPLEARSDLTPDFITTVVRQGLGNMPRIGRGEVSEAQLGRIAAYLAKAPAS